MSERHLDRELLHLLRASGCDYTIEHGKKHLQVRIGGKLVLVLSRGADRAYHARYNDRATLRRALKQMETRR